MTTWYLITWISWSCPGGILSGLWPEQAKPLLCTPQPQLELETRPDQALKRLREHHPARVYVFNGLKRKELKVNVETHITAEGL